jgi:hypothetical protein
MLQAGHDPSTSRRLQVWWNGVSQRQISRITNHFTQSIGSVGVCHADVRICEAKGTSGTG